MDTPSKPFVSIVTGGSRGIGRAIALRLAETTAVLIVAKDEEKLKSVCEEIRSKGGTAFYLVGDVKDPAIAGAAIANASLVGPIRNLVLNAGISKSGASASFPNSGLEELFNVNVVGSINFVKAALGGMVTAGAGTIIFLAGTAGIQGYGSMAGYCATKHALVGYARALAAEVGRKGISVVSVCPGPTDTDMTAPIVDMMVKKGMTVEAAKAKIGQNSGQPGLLSPDEVAQVVSSVCSKSIDFVNGEPLTMTLPMPIAP